MNSKTRAEVVICGAGIAGIAAAHSLAVVHSVRDVVLIDELPPMTLTSDKSTEAYRNWWPGPDDAMVKLMNRSIDMLESWADANGNQFLLNRRGYLYATANALKVEQFLSDAKLASSQGAGDVRIYHNANDAKTYQPSAHRGFHNHPTGADIFLDRSAIRAQFPYLSPDVKAVIHARRCGWMSGQQLGMYLLDAAKEAGVTTLSGRLRAVNTTNGAVSSVTVVTSDGVEHTIATSTFINAAGPYAREVGALMGVDLPLFSEMHLKAAFEDTLEVIDRNAGLVILDDAQSLTWSDDERAELASDESTRWLTQQMPAGIHLRPEGYGRNQTVLMLWDYHSSHRYGAPIFPLEDDPVYAEVVMRGMVALAPALAPYVERLPHMYIDGGYYTKTEENRPLVGPTSVRGAFVNCAFSGYGLMAAPAAGELLAAHILGHAMPEHASAFTLDRYDRAEYQTQLAAWGNTGQL
ncbi:MAG: FAD-binding oxidoreductase [Gemmatimonadaceae bacterium]